jgi:hypothetical protein
MRMRVLAVIAFAALAISTAALADWRSDMRENCDDAVQNRLNPYVVNTQMGQVFRAPDGFSLEGDASMRNGSTRHFTCIFSPDRRFTRVDVSGRGGDDGPAPGYGGGVPRDAMLRTCRWQAAREMGINVKYVIGTFDGYRNGNAAFRMQNQTGALVYRCLVDQQSGQITRIFREGDDGPGYGPGPGYGVDRDTMLRTCKGRASEILNTRPIYIDGYFESAGGGRSIFLVRDQNGGPRYRCVVDGGSGQIMNFARAD